jgi:autotransporter adhesin
MASAANSTALGYTSLASGSNASAIGYDSLASGLNGIALGARAQATAANSVALGAGSVASRANTVSVGAAGMERQIVNVAAGTAATDAVNVSQLEGVMGDVHNEITNVYNYIEKVEEGASRGIAAVAALAQPMYFPEPGAGMAAVGSGYYDGESALAVSFGYLDEGGSIAYSGGIGMGLSGGEPVARVGVTFRLF